MADLDMAAAAHANLACVPLDIIFMVLKTMTLEDRFTCALVCKAWATAAAATTRNVVAKLTSWQKSKCLHQWLEKHGNQLEVLHLHGRGGAGLTALPCAQLQDLQLIGVQYASDIHIDIKVWGDIAAATKLTTVTLSRVSTASQQTDVVSALTALRDLKQLTWHYVRCSSQQQLSDSLLLQQLTNLTALDCRDVSAAALEHLSSLTKLQNLSLGAAQDWAAAGCRELRELKALTRLQLWHSVQEIPASVCQLTALQQLDMRRATPTALNTLQALTGLTHLYVQQLSGLSLQSPPLQLPGLQHLVMFVSYAPLPVSFLASCTELRLLELLSGDLSVPGSLVASTMLQHLVLDSCRLSAADGAADSPVSWQQVFPGPGRLPHLTSLQLLRIHPGLQQVDVEHVVACCSSLQVLHLQTLKGFASALAQLSGLTKLHLEEAGDGQCSALAQLTELREVILDNPREVSAAGLQQLAVLEQLTSLAFAFTWPRRVNPVLQKQMSDKLSDYKYAMVNQVPAGHPSDVSARLLRMASACDHYRIDLLCIHTARLKLGHPAPLTAEDCHNPGRG